MIDLNKVTASWMKSEDGWLIAPKGLAWIGEGNHLKIGNECRLGDRALDPIDIGYADGYRKCVCNVSGVAYIGAGCRWFCLADALEHWSDRDDRDMTNCLMMAAIHIAVVKGWSHE